MFRFLLPQLHPVDCLPSSIGLTGRVMPQLLWLLLCYHVTLLWWFNGYLRTSFLLLRQLFRLSQAHLSASLCRGWHESLPKLSGNVCGRSSVSPPRTIWLLFKCLWARIRWLIQQSKRDCWLWYVATIDSRTSPLLGCGCRYGSFWVPPTGWNPVTQNSRYSPYWPDSNCWAHGRALCKLPCGRNVQCRFLRSQRVVEWRQLSFCAHWRELYNVSFKDHN